MYQRLGRGSQRRTRIPLLSGQRARPPSQREQRLQITPLPHLRSHRLHRGDRLRPPLGDRHQSEMPGRRVHLRSPPQGAEHRHPRRVERLPQHPLVPFGGHLVEDHPGDPHLRVPGGETVHQRGHGPGLRGRVHDQHHGRPQQLRHMSGGGQLTLPRGPVEQPHHTFDDGEITAARPVGEQRRDQLRPAHVGVEVPPHPPGGERVIPGIDVVGPDLVRGHGKPRAAKAAISPVATVVLPLPDEGAATTSRGTEELTTRCLSGPSGRRPSDA